MRTVPLLPLHVVLFEGNLDCNMDREEFPGEVSSKASNDTASNTTESYSSRQVGAPDTHSQSSDQSRQSHKSSADLSQWSSRSRRSDGEKSTGTNSSRQSSRNSSRPADDMRRKESSKGDDRSKRSGDRHEGLSSSSSSIRDTRKERSSTSTRSFLEDRSSRKTRDDVDKNRSFRVSRGTHTEVKEHRTSNSSITSDLSNQGQNVTRSDRMTLNDRYERRRNTDGSTLNKRIDRTRSPSSPNLDDKGRSNGTRVDFNRNTSSKVSRGSNSEGDGIRLSNSSITSDLSKEDQSVCCSDTFTVSDQVERRRNTDSGTLDKRIDRARSPPHIVPDDKHRSSRGSRDNLDKTKSIKVSSGTNSGDNSYRIGSSQKNDISEADQNIALRDVVIADDHRDRQNIVERKVDIRIERTRSQPRSSFESRSRRCTPDDAKEGPTTTTRIGTRNQDDSSRPRSRVSASGNIKRDITSPSTEVRYSSHQNDVYLKSNSLRSIQGQQAQDSFFSKSDYADARNHDSCSDVMDAQSSNSGLRSIHSAMELNYRNKHSQSSQATAKSRHDTEGNGRSKHTHIRQRPRDGTAMERNDRSHDTSRRRNHIDNCIPNSSSDNTKTAHNVITSVLTCDVVGQESRVAVDMGSSSRSNESRRRSRESDGNDDHSRSSRGSRQHSTHDGRRKGKKNHEVDNGPHRVEESSRHSRGSPHESQCSTDKIKFNELHEEGNDHNNRREFWGISQSDRGLAKCNSSVTEFIGRDHIIGLATIPTPGNSAMFGIFDKGLTDLQMNPDVLRVFKLMFASLSVVFCETSINSKDPDRPFCYTRSPSVPVQAARMLWSELLGEVNCLYCSNTGMYKAQIADHDISPKWDLSLTEDVVSTFIKYVNGEEVPEAPRPLSGFFSRFLLSRNAASPAKMLGVGAKHVPEMGSCETTTDKERKDRQKKTMDPFLFQIQEFLLQQEYLILVGRKIDDQDEMEMKAEFDESDLTLESEEEENFDGDESDAELHFSRWDGNKRKSSSRSRSQFFQISKDMQHQYGVYNSSRHVCDGGFAILDIHNNDAISQTDAMALREFDTMKRWNDTMSRACLRKLYEDRIIFIGHECDSYDERILDDKMPGMRTRNSFGDAMTYALQMYPSHLMKSGRVMEASHMLTNSRFFFGRALAVGAFDATIRHRSNLDELIHRSRLAREGIYSLGGDGGAVNVVDVRKATVAIMISVLTEQFPICDMATAVKGEQEKGEVGRALHYIASFLAECGDIQTAIGIYERALNWKVAALGEDHSSVGRTYRHMGHQHLFQYQYDEAIRCYGESVRIERTHGEIDYRRVILSLNSMGMIYGMTGKHEMAVETYAQSLAIQKPNLGDSHPQVAETLNSMGIVYGMMGVFDKSVECYSEALFIKIRKRGADHLDVADVQFNLGLVHTKRGDHDSAINCYQEALRIRKDKYGEEHEEVARVLHHIGVVLSDMGEAGDAIRFYEECLRIRRLILGDEHEDVARTLHNLGLVYYDSSNYSRALECFEDSLQLVRQKVGNRSEKVADTLHSMGLVHQKLARFQEAIACYDEAVMIRRAKLGPDHLEVASTLHNMGDVYYMLGELDKAMEAYMEAYKYRLEKLGAEDIDVAATQNNMGVVYMKKSDHEKAMQSFIAALRIREANLGPDHEKCSDTLHNMGLVHKNIKQYDHAIVRYEQALRARRMQLGDVDMKVADTLYNMGIVYANTGKFAFALEKYKEALRTYRETGMADDHPSVVNTLQWIKWAQKKVSKSPRKDATVG